MIPQTEIEYDSLTSESKTKCDITRKRNKTDKRELATKPPFDASRWCFIAPAG